RSLPRVIRALCDDLLHVLFPIRCLGCGRGGAPVCAECLGRLRTAPRLAPPPGIDWSVACFAYEGLAREVVGRGRDRDQRASLRACVPVWVRGVEPVATEIDAVTWVPASAARRRAHGVDHGELLARAVADALQVPALALLRRLRSDAQTGRDALSRRTG